MTIRPLLKKLTTQKIDSPSGTAITLAEKIIDNSNYKSWTLKENKHDELPIKVNRIETKEIILNTIHRLIQLK